MNPTLTKTYVAGEAVTKRRIAAFGSADGKAILAASAAVAMFGVFADLDAAAAARVDVHEAGIVEIELGGTVSRGDPITAKSDGTGKGVKAEYDGSGKVYVVGRAMVSGVSGDIIPVKIALGRIDPGKVQVPFSINETDLLAATSHFVVAPATGNITKVTTVVQKAVGTGGTITIEVATVAVDGLSVVVADSAAAGDIDSDEPSAPDHATTAIVKDAAIEIVPAAAFATTGALNGFIEITL